MSQFSKYDSEFCGNIPIHIINTIQEYGVLLVLDKQTLTIEQVSENAAELFQMPFRDLLGKTIKDLIDASAFALLEKQAQENYSTKISTVWKLDTRDHFTILHVREDMVLVEIEIAQAPAAGGATFTALYQHIRNSIDLIEQARDVHDLCRIAANELKKITWFDKVMIYAFDQDWNGNVLAEAMEPDMESYLGFTFPASDIPKPARDLYLRNPYRFIPDREFKPVKLYPVINPISRSFLDMSECNLRGVAAVHVEYLKNMHVMSSMSVRLIKDNALWGLIACHHKTARVIDGEMRAVMELFSSVISARINALHHQSFSDLTSRLNGIYMQLIESIYQTDNLVSSLLSTELNVMKLLDATGVIITYNNRSHKAGEVPDAAQLEDLLLWLHIKDLKKVFHTDSLPSIYDITEQYREIASGMLVIPMRPEQDEYIILFRKEFIRTTNWGGNPEERMFFDENPQIYHPRHSFKLWQEHVKGFSKPWLPEEVMAAENLRSFIFEFLTREHSKE
ncbi:MAG TPA: GAF domain-containing protein [Chitinophaga sp.]|uniref:GAF domain-containing protein n=1 Tax=Chitinophaga sp. TaxID=1869181 RepID=UPI002F9445F4